MNFRSDNVMGASPEILRAIADSAEGAAGSYGADELTAKVERRLADIFEHEVAVLPVATGTAANSLCLSALTPPWGAVYCHPEAHIMLDECGAPELFSGGAKLVGVAGPNGRFDAASLKSAIYGKGNVHAVQPSAVSVTQASEAGTVYPLDALAAIGEVARGHGLGYHLDGARFANALVSLGCSPAEMTWRAGVDLVSFGATKNGCLAAEAIISFDPAWREELAFRRKRSGHLFSKMRFLSAQLLAYLADDLWLENARHANAMATRLSAGLSRLPGVTLAHPVQANEIFVDLPEPALMALEAAGYGLYRWNGPGTTLARLVTSFATRAKDVDGFVATATAGLTAQAAQ